MKAKLQFLEDKTESLPFITRTEKRTQTLDAAGFGCRRQWSFIRSSRCLDEECIQSGDLQVMWSKRNLSVLLSLCFCCVFFFWILFPFLKMKS